MSLGPGRLSRDDAPIGGPEGTDLPTVANAATVLGLFLEIVWVFNDKNAYRSVRHADTKRLARGELGDDR